jgi:hypothetical protein
MIRAAPLRRSASSSATSQKKTTATSQITDDAAQASAELAEAIEDDLYDRRPEKKMKRSGEPMETSAPSSSNANANVANSSFLYRPDGSKKTDKELFGDNPNYRELHESFLRASGLEKPSISATSQQNYPSMGSAFHSSGFCWPCRIYHGKGCKNGAQCNRCHLCPKGEDNKLISALRRSMVADASVVDVYAEYAKLVADRRHY